MSSDSFQQLNAIAGAGHTKNPASEKNSPFRPVEDRFDGIDRARNTISLRNPKTRFQKSGIMCCDTTSCSRCSKSQRCPIKSQTTSIRHSVRPSNPRCLIAKDPLSLPSLMKEIVQITVTRDILGAQGSPSGPTFLSNMTDGANDELAPLSPSAHRRRSSLNDLINTSPLGLRVHFRSSESLENPEQQFRSQWKFKFNDPFGSESDCWSRRGSDSSDGSMFLRPNAFLGHRDTLVRFPRLGRVNNHEGKRKAESSLSDADTFILAAAFRGHRDTLARLRSAENLMGLLPQSIVRRLCQYLRFRDYLHLRLTCRSLKQVLPSPKFPASYRVPPEVLQFIFACLNPNDFDAARHTCKTWYLISLDHRLGLKMLELASCYGAFIEDVSHHTGDPNIGLKPQSLGTRTSFIGKCQKDLVGHDDQTNQEWLISKRLATESRLHSGWRGSGLQSNEHSKNRMSVIEEVNFQKILSPDVEMDRSESRVFTVSVCGKFVLINTGSDIFVYDLFESQGPAEPVVRLVAGRKILGVSMDTSSGRYAVAALLDGRIGASWDLEISYNLSQDLPVNDEAMSLGLRTEVSGILNQRTEVEFHYEPATPWIQDSQTSAEHKAIVYDAQEAVPYLTDSPESASAWLDEDLKRDIDLSASAISPDSGLIAAPIQTRPTAIYSNLGSLSDCPRSVAICPQRKCVAFGCRTGIELHWIDPHTGGSLNRWFPLAAPSDFLYFLPQRPGIDSNKKLRLISSASGPSRQVRSRHNSVPTKIKFCATGPRHGRMQSMTRLFFGTLPFPTGLRRTSGSQGIDESDSHGVLRTVDCDHYRAIPLSDGAHMLFTDPMSGLLCLGSDAPLGGPTKLVRKVCMVPPFGQHPAAASAVSCYAAGYDLRWGIRIVAAYDNGSVILYNIPSDCFERIRSVRSSPDAWNELSGVLGQSDLLMDVVMTAHSNLSTELEAANEASRRSSTSSNTSLTFKSLQIDGALIWQSQCEVDDVQVDCTGGGLKVWIFTSQGQATRLDIYAAKDFEARQSHVGTDGFFRVLEADEK